MIELKKLERVHVEVLKDAVHLKFKNLVIENNPNEASKIEQSILQDVYSKFFDAYAKSYRQLKFKFKLKWHEAVLINKALSFYTNHETNDYNKNLALKLILVIDPQIVSQK